MIPPAYQFVLLALAAFRVWRLLAEDDILDRPRRRLLHLDDNNEPADDREEWTLFLICPWCLGFWLSLGVYLLWVWFPTETMYVATVFALSAAVGLIRGNLDPPEE